MFGFGSGLWLFALGLFLETFSQARYNEFYCISFFFGIINLWFPINTLKSVI